jgi:hypothetical protein
MDSKHQSQLLKQMQGAAGSEVNPADAAQSQQRVDASVEEREDTSQASFLPISLGQPFCLPQIISNEQDFVSSVLIRRALYSARRISRVLKRATK